MPAAPKRPPRARAGLLLCLAGAFLSRLPRAAGDCTVGPVRLSFQGGREEGSVPTSEELRAVWSQCGERSCSGEWTKLGRRTGWFNFCQDLYIRASGSYGSWDFRNQVLSAMLDTGPRSDCGWICRDGGVRNAAGFSGAPACDTYSLILGRIPGSPDWINLEQKVTNC
jgi:hypothetical protein